MTLLGGLGLYLSRADLGRMTITDDLSPILSLTMIVVGSMWSFSAAPITAILHLSWRMQQAPD